MSGKSENIIELKHISKVYSDNGFKAVDDFNLEVKRGEFVTFLGPSGCGKTTTLRMIAGFELPTDGQILLNGEDISQLPANKRPINTVFQRYALFPHMNIYENIAFGLKLKKLPKEEIRKKVKHVLDMVDLEGFEDRKISTLSGGQQQRIAIARALVNEPEILMLDEPLGALDLKMRKEMQIELKNMHDQLGITFIYVTHDQTEAMTMGDRIVVMKDGVVQQINKPKVLYDNPVNKFVASFIGSPQMNFMDAEILKDGEDIVASLPGKEVKFLIPKGKAAFLEEKGYVGKTITIGIRPEDIHKEKVFLDMSENSQFKADVVIRELMGAEIYAYLNFKGTELIAKFDGRSDIMPGQTLDLALDMNRMHFFDKETEENILFDVE